MILFVLHFSSFSLLAQYWKVLFCKIVEQERFCLFQVQPRKIALSTFVNISQTSLLLFFYSLSCESNCFSSAPTFTDLTVACFNYFVGFLLDV